MIDSIIWSLLCNVVVGILCGAGNLFPPRGLLGVQWGDDATGAVTHLELRCPTWSPWEGGQGYEACADFDHLVNAFGHKAYVRLFRSQGRIEALALGFKQCSAIRSQLTDDINSAFRVRVDVGEVSIYTVFWNKAVVHLAYGSADDTCNLTIAGPRFGEAFVSQLIHEGLQNLGRGMMAH